MKKLLLFLMTALALAFISCGNASANETEPKKDPAPEKTTEEKTTVTETKETKIILAEDTELYKTVGRGFVDENGLHLPFAGDALEFRVTCSGTLSMTYSADDDLYFQIYMDGGEYNRLLAKKGKNMTLVLAEDLEEYEYTFRIQRDSDAMPKAPVTTVSAISFTGDKESVSPTEENEILIEFVGDSITAGKYTETQYEIDDLAIHKPTNSYAYLTAEALGADYSIVARGGCGFFRVATCPKTMNQLYPYYNGFMENPVPYTATRKADIVVIALGTNDSETNVTESFSNGTVPFSNFKDALKDQIRLVREMHGSDVEIIIMYNMMSSGWAEEFKAVAAEENTHILKVTRNKDGGKSHPSKAGHKTIAKELTKYIEDNIL